jgi:hypothetical protein
MSESIQHSPDQAETISVHLIDEAAECYQRLAEKYGITATEAAYACMNMGRGILENMERGYSLRMAKHVPFTRKEKVLTYDFSEMAIRQPTMRIFALAERN